MKFTKSLSIYGLLSAMMITSCKTTDHAEVGDAASKTKPPPTTMRNQAGDVAFQAFLSRLRAAVKRHDVETIASMMTTDFGYRLDPVGEGDGVFKYWDENNIWPELQLVVSEQFVPSGAVYMVAPPEFATQSTTYSGYRAGIRSDNGTWKFAYFVSGQ